MNVARRLYIYGVLAVSLAILTFGAVQLFELAFEIVFDRFAGDVLATTEIDVQRQALSQALALIVVSGPLWLLHWWLAERRARDDHEERASAIRLAYLTGALGAALLIGLSPAIEIVEALLRALFDAPGGDPYAANDPEGWLAALLGLALVWLLHAAILRSDLRALPGAAPARWPFRLYLYGAAGLGLIVLLAGATDLAQLFTDLAFVDRVLAPEGEFWRRSLASGLATAAVGLLLWAGHWRYSLRLVHGPVETAASERDSTIRRVYLYGAIVTGVFMTLLRVSGGLQEPLRLLLSVSDASTTRDALREIAGPLLEAVPFAAVWLAHRRALEREAASGETETQAGLSRLYIYLLAFAGLAVGGAALAYLLGILIDLAFDGGRTVSVGNDWWREQIARYAPLALAGGLVWLWHWNRAVARVRRDPHDERRALSRRVYVYAVLGIALIASIIGLGVVVYQIFEALFGVSGNDGFIEDTSAAFGALLVGAALVAFHGLVLRGDLDAEERATDAEIRRPLLLVVPPGSDPAAAIERLRAALPDDHRLEER